MGCELAQQAGALRWRIEERVDADDARRAAIELADRRVLFALARRHDHHHAAMALERGDRRREPVAGGIEDDVPLALQWLSSRKTCAHRTLDLGMTQACEMHSRGADCARGAADELPHACAAAH